MPFSVERDPDGEAWPCVMFGVSILLPPKIELFIESYKWPVSSSPLLKPSVCEYFVEQGCRRAEMPGHCRCSGPLSPGLEALGGGKAGTPRPPSAVFRGSKAST